MTTERAVVLAIIFVLGACIGFLAEEERRATADPPMGCKGTIYNHEHVGGGQWCEPKLTCPKGPRG